MTRREGGEIRQHDRQVAAFSRHTPSRLRQLTPLISPMPERELVIACCHARYVDVRATRVDTTLPPYYGARTQR